jgi:hypothetical protein
MMTILQNLATGAAKVTAAQAAGIGRVTLYHWLKRGAELYQRLQAGEDITELVELDWRCLRLYELVQAVEAGVELDLLRIVLSEGGRGARWLLSRKFQDRYTVKQTTEVQHHGAIQLKWGDPVDATVIDGAFRPVAERDLEEDLLHPSRDIPDRTLLGAGDSEADEE